MDGKCKLCGKDGKLEHSHIVPKFVGRWIKRTSATGHFRRADNINLRTQDLAKEYWLCGACEDLFEKWETKFSNNVFYPFVQNHKDVFHYQEWMSKFCTSLSWRTLTYIREKGKAKDHSQYYINAVQECELHWRRYLLGDVNNLDQFEQHLYQFVPIRDDNKLGLPININRYLLRAIAIDIIGSETEYFVYTKLPCFLLIGVIKCNELSKMRSSRISLRTGHLSPDIGYFPDNFFSHICNSANRMHKQYGSMNDKQRARINNYINSHPDKVRRSHTLRALLDDRKMQDRRK